MSDEDDRHWVEIAGSFIRGIITNVFVWVITAGMAGWLAHSTMSPRSDIHSDLDLIKNQVLLMNVKWQAFVDSQPKSAQERYQAILAPRLQVLAAAGKPIEP
jgi:hypothetical protein